METVETETESKAIVRFEQRLKYFQNVLELKKRIKSSVKEQIEDKKNGKGNDSTADSAKSSYMIRAFQITALLNFYNKYRGKTDANYFHGSEKYREVCYYLSAYRSLEKEFDDGMNVRPRRVVDKYKIDDQV